MDFLLIVLLKGVITCVNINTKIINHNLTWQRLLAPKFRLNNKILYAFRKYFELKNNSKRMSRFS